MTTHERFTRMYQHREADRVPYRDYPWQETLERWISEGLPTRDYLAYFDLDKTASISVDNSPRLPAKVIEENDEFVISTTPWGATRRNFKHHTTTPEPLGFQVTTPDEWLKIKERIAPTRDRIPWDYLQKNYRQWRNEGRWITGGLWFGFDITHSGMVGTENLLFAMKDEPEWVMDMFETELDTDLKLMDMVWEAGYTFDELTWPDDMGYKGTQFFSLSTYRELLKPFHQRAIDWGHAHGCFVHLHSCGNIMPLVPELVDMGLDGLNPLEVKAGMQPEELKRRYGDRLLFHGGTNAARWHELDVILPQIRELVPRMMENGGYVFSSDHSIPAQVSLKAFTEIIKTYKEVGTY
ncbi:MAG: hypothetical protein K5663_11755 [Clostridiales bacterium]|nr:hypothetical protein [Clostridiales bacterium]